MLRCPTVWIVGLVGLVSSVQLSAQHVHDGIVVRAGESSVASSVVPASMQVGGKSEKSAEEGKAKVAKPAPSKPPKQKARYSMSRLANNCCGLSGHVEFLWWTASQTRLSYAAVSFTPEPDPVVGSIDFLGFDWDPGVRVGASYKLPCNCWEVGAEFTYVELRADGPRAFAPPGGALYTILAYPSVDSSEEGIASHRIDYYLLDLLAKRSFCCCNSLLSPFIGVRLAEIDQTLRYTYEGGLPIENNRGLVDLKFRGIGLVGGLEGEACVWGELSLFGKTSLGLLAGRDRNRQTQNPLDPSEPSSLAPSDVTLHFDGSRAIADVAAGLQWKCGCLTLRAGYEFHHWFNFSQFAQWLDATNQQAILPAEQGHLSVHGLVLTAAYQL